MTLKKMKLPLACFLLLPCFFVLSCSDFHNDLFPVVENLMHAKVIKSFSFGGVDMSVDGNAITGNIPFYMDIESAAAEFEASGSRITVNGVDQQSGQTLNDFSSPVVYVVTAPDGSTREYTVNLTNTATLTDIVASGMSNPWGIVYHGGSLYVADPGSTCVYKVATSGTFIPYMSYPDVKDLAFAEILGTEYIFLAKDSAAASYAPTTDLSSVSDITGVNANGLTAYLDNIYCTLDRIANNVAGLDLSSGSAVELSTYGASGYPSYGLCVMGGNIYVASSGGHCITVLSRSDMSFVENIGTGEAGDADGTFGSSQFNSPMDVATDGTNLYVADSVSMNVKKLTATGKVKTIMTFSGSVRGVVWVESQKALFVTNADKVSVIR